eukprot:UN3121
MKSVYRLAREQEFRKVKEEVRVAKCLGYRPAIEWRVARRCLKFAREAHSSTMMKQAVGIARLCRRTNVRLVNACADLSEHWERQGQSDEEEAQRQQRKTEEVLEYAREAEEYAREGEDYFMNTMIYGEEI